MRAGNDFIVDKDGSPRCPARRCEKVQAETRKIYSILYASGSRTAHCQGGRAGEGGRHRKVLQTVVLGPPRMNPKRGRWFFEREVRASTTRLAQFTSSCFPRVNESDVVPHRWATSKPRTPPRNFGDVLLRGTGKRLHPRDWFHADGWPLCRDGRLTILTGTGSSNPEELDIAGGLAGEHLFGWKKANRYARQDVPCPRAGSLCTTSSTGRRRHAPAHVFRPWSWALAQSKAQKLRGLRFRALGLGALRDSGGPIRSGGELRFELRVNFLVRGRRLIVVRSSSLVTVTPIRIVVRALPFGQRFPRSSLADGRIGAAGLFRARGQSASVTDQRLNGWLRYC